MGKRGRWRIQELPTFLKYRYSLLSEERVELQTSNLAGIFTGSIRAKALLQKKLGENGVWAYPGTPEIFGVPPIISGTRKATNFKFGKYIQTVHANKRPLNLEVKRAWAYAIHLAYRTLSERFH